MSDGKNHICKKCGGIAGWDSYFQSWICTRCGNEELKPKTNADRIRAMDDEELAEYIYRILENINGNPETCPSLTFLKQWLSQEAN